MADRTALVDELRELYGRTAYSHCTHEMMTNSLECWHRFWFWTDVVLIAIGATGLITQTVAALPSSLLELPLFASVVPAISSTAALFVTLVTQRSDADRRIVEHRKAASELWLIRERLVSILADLRDLALTPEMARKYRDEILDSLKEVYQKAPRTNGRAFAAARRALKQDELLTFTDEELNIMLPETLQQGRGSKSL